MRKEEKEMKKIKIFVGVFLCMNLFTISGCDKVIHSAVVEEKDKTAAKKEENKEKETVQKTVTEQVQAPKTYQTTIQSDLRSAERTDQENPMKFTLTADAPIEVPDVGAICLKNVKKMTISEPPKPNTCNDNHNYSQHYYPCSFFHIFPPFWIL